MPSLKALLEQLHEKKLYFDLKRTKLNNNSIVIDCGANVGKFTSVFADKNCRVISFEPNDHAFQVLQNSFGSKANVTLINGAVWTEDTELPLFHHVNSDEDEVKWSTGSSLVGDKGNVSKDKFKLVKAFNLSRFIKELNQPVDILKIDIEGAEIEVLNKLIDENIHQVCGKILVETHPQIESTRKGLAELHDRIKKLNIKNINLNWI